MQTQANLSARCRNTYHTLCSSSECKCSCHSWLHPLLDAVRSDGDLILEDGIHKDDPKEREAMQHGIKASKETNEDRDADTD